MTIFLREITCNFSTGEFVQFHVIFDNDNSNNMYLFGLKTLFFNSLRSGYIETLANFGDSLLPESLAKISNSLTDLSDENKFGFLIDNWEPSK